MNLAEIQVAVLVGLVAGIVLWPRALTWPLAIAGALPRSRSVGRVAAIALLHSGPWVLALIVFGMYYALTRFPQPKVHWFLGALYASLLLELLLVWHLFRSGSIGNHGKFSPVSWFAKAVRRKRGFFIFGYVVAAFIILPHLLQFRQYPGFMLFALLVSIAGAHFLFWYIWQFRPPEFDAAGTSEREENGDKGTAA